MTSTIKVNTITTESGSTLTIGGCGKTVALASGASQTGFGRSGSVNWDTTAKTGTFTGVSGNGYFINTTGSAFTVNLPASPNAGDIMAIKDYTGTFATNACTIGRNSSNIRGAAADFVLNKTNAGATLVYVDGTEGWQIFVDGSDSDGQAQFICASVSGSCNTLATAPCGNFKIATFKGPGNFTVNSLACSPANNIVDYLVVGSGGGGADQRAGGGGAGGFRMSNDLCMPAPTTSPLAAPTGITVTEQAYPITIAAGGAGTAGFPTPGQKGTPGGNSVFSSITTNGGGGSANDFPSNTVGLPGASGGGGVRAGGSPGGAAPGGTGNTPPVTPPQGNPGGGGASGPYWGAGGGGGAAAAGGDGTPSPAVGGAGGIGSFVSPTMAGCNGTTGPVPGVRYFSGGGGGSFYCQGTAGSGGSGGGGNAGTGPGPAPGAAGAAGTANTGGGGGGGYHPSPGQAGGNGGSGIVIIRYKFQ